MSWSGDPPNLQCVKKFILDIWLLAGKENTITGALSRVEVHAIVDVLDLDFEAMRAAQENNVKLKNMSSYRKVLQLEIFFPARFDAMYQQELHVLLLPKSFVDESFTVPTILRTRASVVQYPPYMF